MDKNEKSNEKMIYVVFLQFYIVKIIEFNKKLEYNKIKLKNIRG